MSWVHRPFWLTALVCSILLSSCAPSRQLAAVPPGHQYRVADIVDVQAPNSTGWHLVESSAKGLSFAKRARGPGETFAAQLLMFDLQPTETPEQFTDLIRTTIERGTNPKRFETVQSSAEHTTDRPYPCVRHRAVYNDKHAQTSPTTSERLLFEIQALYCRHPERTNAVFAAVYSHRGRSPYPALVEEAQHYFKGVRVP